MKPTKKASTAAKPTIESVLDDAIATLASALGHIQTEIDAIKAGTARKTKHDPASRVAFLAGGVGRIVDSLRKTESARARRLEDMTPATVLAWLRSLDASERAQIIREATIIDSRKSGLG